MSNPLLYTDTDFTTSGGLVDPEQLREEFVAANFPSTPAIFSHIDTSGIGATLLVSVFFDVIPNATDEATADAIVAAHTATGPTQLIILTDGKIPLFDNGGELIDSSITELLGKIGIATTSPNAPFDMTGDSPGIVGGFASGAFHITSPSTDVNANAVITGHNSFGGNKQLWYLGSGSSSNDNITLLNRQNGSLSLGTNNIDRFTIDSVGGITVTGDFTAGQIDSGNLRINGNVLSSTDTNGLILIAPNGTGSVIILTNFVATQGTSPAATGDGSELVEFRDNRTTIGSAPNYVFSINRQNSPTAALYLGNDGDDNALIVTNNRALIIGNDISGSFTENMRVETDGVLSSPGDLDLTTGTGGVFKFTDNAFQAGLDAVEFVEMGHGGTNGFINAVGDGGLDFRFEGTTLATFTDFGHLHLMTNVDQKHTLKIITNNNINDTGIAWENSGGSFTGTLFRTDVGSNRADLVFAAGLNTNIDLLTNALIIHGSVAENAKIEIPTALQLSIGTPSIGDVWTTTDTIGNGVWQTPVTTPVTGQFSHSVSQKPSVTTPISLLFDTEDITLQGIAHSTTVKPEEFKATIQKPFTFMLAPQWERTTSGGTRTIDFFAQKSTDGGTVFTDVDNSNIKAKPGSNDSNVIPLMATIPMNVDDIVRFQMRVSTTTDGLGTVFTAAEVGPPTIPATPAQILTIFSGD